MTKYHTLVSDARTPRGLSGPSLFGARRSCPGRTLLDVRPFAKIASVAEGTEILKHRSSSPRKRHNVIYVKLASGVCRGVCAAENAHKAIAPQHPVSEAQRRLSSVTALPIRSAPPSLGSNRRYVRGSSGSSCHLVGTRVVSVVSLGPFLKCEKRLAPRAPLRFVRPRRDLGRRSRHLPISRLPPVVGPDGQEVFKVLIIGIPPAKIRDSQSSLLQCLAP
jgi:hypothetical protein